MACQQASSAARHGGIVQCQMPRKVQTEQLVGCAQHYGVQDQRVQIPQHPVPGQFGEAPRPSRKSVPMRPSSEITGERWYCSTKRNSSRCSSAVRIYRPNMAWNASRAADPPPGDR